MIELDILKLLISNKELYNKYYSYIDLNYLKINYNIIYKLYIIINLFYTKFEDKSSISFEDLESLYLTNYPAIKDIQREELTSVLTRLQACKPSEDVIVELLESHRVRSIATDVAKTALNVAEGQAEPSELLSLVDSISDAGSEVQEFDYVTTDLEELYETQVKKQGLRWPLEWLNRALGSLRPGDFGFIFARPETGKTTFLAHVGTYMASQADGDLIWFNNEEQGDKVGLRCYQAALGVTVGDLFKGRKENQKLYKDMVGDKIKIIDESNITKQMVESVLRGSNPKIIFFDQIDKIKGFEGDRKDLELGKIYQWARGLAKTYAPVIGVCQADGSGEGVKWLTMSHVADAKTSKQAEADWILGIGKSHDPGYNSVRFLNISKNKLYGDEDSLPDLRHGQTQVIIDPEKARYIDLSKKI